jgi:CubicO group peptidase (beta-lactamase class C family)
MSDPDAKPEDVGMSRSGLERARAHVAAAVDRGEIAGAVLFVARNDQVVQIASIGLRDIEARAPMAPDAIFRLGSMTKPITSVAVLMLVEAGKLQLEDSAAQYVPELTSVEVFAGIEGGKVQLAPLQRPITIFDLLTHTSGLAYGAPVPELADTWWDTFSSPDQELPEFTRRVTAHPLAHQPGADWAYGLSDDVLGRVIEVVAGESLNEYLARHLFGPMGMVDTGFVVPPEKLSRLAAVYELTAAGLVRFEDWYIDRSTMPRLLSGGNGLVSTAPDYLRLCRMLLGRGELDGIRLLGPESVAAMLSNQLPATLDHVRHDRAALDGQGYGYGVGVTVDPAHTGQPGSAGTFRWGGWNAKFWVEPASALICIYMVQSTPYAMHDSGTQFWSLVRDSVLV